MKNKFNTLEEAMAAYPIETDTSEITRQIKIPKKSSQIEDYIAKYPIIAEDEYSLIFNITESNLNYSCIGYFFDGVSYYAVKDKITYSLCPASWCDYINKKHKKHLSYYNFKNEK